MQLEALTHLTRAALELIGPEATLIVAGSSSLLGSFPELGNETGPLGASYDADIVPVPFSEDIGVMLHEALGEDRRFHQLHGYCADILRPQIEEQFPKGWNERLIPLKELPRVKCLEPHDLAAAKCQAGREKDISLLVSLAKGEWINLDIVAERLRNTQMTESQIVKAHQTLGKVRDLSGA